MTVTKGVALAFALAAAGALVQAGATGSSTVPTARLKTITSRVDSKGTSLVVESTEPVPYVTTRPDALTVVLELRNVDAQSVTKKLSGTKGGAIADVTVENADSLGAPNSRVRIVLAEAVAHRVRSEKNQIIVEFEKKDGKSTPYVMAPLSRDLASVELAGGLGTGAADPIAALSLQALAAPLAAQAPAAAAQVATQAGGPQASQGSGDARKFTGAPISVTFEDADLKSVLALFADEEGINLATDPGVSGTVNVRFTDVPWDQALDNILRMNKLGSIVDGTIVRIAPIATLANEASDRRKLADAQANEGELRTLTKTLSYAKADQMAPLLTKSNTLSPRGTVQLDPRTNTLIITDLQSRITAAIDLIAALDKAEAQVEIEARIVQTNRNYERRMGVQWGFAGRADAALGNTTNLAFPNSIGIGGGATPGATVAGTSPNTAVNLAAPGATSAVGLALGSINGAFNLDVALSALETSGNGRVLSTPKVTTQNNIEAEMTQGTQIPIQTVSNNTTTVTFHDATLTLKVTPQITAAGTVIMAISLENNSADFSRSINGIPPINTQRAVTKLLVNDGETTVIGGIDTATKQTTKDSTPGLSRLPIINWLFKRDLGIDSNVELLIFITPRIIKS